MNKQDIRRNACQLYGGQATKGYDWWWHNFTAVNSETGEEKAFFAEFFLCNPKLGGATPIFGQSEENKRLRESTGGKEGRPSYLMVKMGTWGKDAVQLHRFFAWDDVTVDMGVPYSVKASDCAVSETYLKGEIHITEAEAKDHPEWMCGFGDIRMDLKIDKKVAFNVGYGAGALFRKLQLFEMFWHAEGMKSLFSGTVEFNGVHYDVIPERSFGYCDKNWGKDFTSPWVWLSSWNAVSELTNETLKDTVFDIGGGCPKVGPVKLPRKLLADFWHEGKSYEFNFSKFWTGCRTKFDCYETDTQIVWHVDQRTFRYRMVTDIVCDKADMLLVAYEAPDGQKRHNRLWNGGNGRGTVELYKGKKLIDRLSVKNVGCEYGEYC